MRSPVSFYWSQVSFFLLVRFLVSGLMNGLDLRTWIERTGAWLSRWRWTCLVNMLAADSRLQQVVTWLLMLAWLMSVSNCLKSVFLKDLVRIVCWCVVAWWMTFSTTTPWWTLSPTGSTLGGETWSWQLV